MDNDEGDGAPEDAEDVIGQVEQEIEGSEKLLDELKGQIDHLSKRLDMALRSLADRENQLKRLQRDLPTQIEAREVSVLKRLLEVADNFERALASIDTTTDLERHREGTRMINDQVKSILDAHQVKVIDALGKPFNPAFHEAVGQVPVPDKPEGTVIDEMQRGYMFKDRVLRHSRVFVSAAVPGAQSAPTPEDPGDVLN